VDRGQASKPQFPSRPSPNPERRAERAARDAATARTCEEHTRNVRTSEPAQDPATWLRQSYANSIGQMVCQICEEEMQFRTTVGTFVGTQLFSGRFTLPQGGAAISALSVKNRVFTMKRLGD
jgi:hypothetical protein